MSDTAKTGSPEAARDSNRPRKLHAASAPPTDVNGDIEVRLILPLGYGQILSGCRDFSAWPMSYVITQTYVLFHLPVYHTAAYRVAADLDAQAGPQPSVGARYSIIRHEPLSAKERRFNSISTVTLTTLLTGWISAYPAYLCITNGLPWVGGIFAIFGAILLMLLRKVHRQHMASDARLREAVEAYAQAHPNEFRILEV